MNIMQNIMQQVLEETLLRKGMDRLASIRSGAAKSCANTCLRLWSSYGKEPFRSGGSIIISYVEELHPQDTPESIYTLFNPPNRPDDFFGRSVSISDVIVLNRDGKVTAYYLDAAKEGGHCFVELPDFISGGKPRLLSVVMEGIPKQKDETAPGYILSDGTVLLDDYLAPCGGFYTGSIGRHGCLTGFCYYPMILNEKVIAFSEMTMVEEA